MGDLTPHFEELSSGFPPFPLWHRLWAVCSDDEIRLYDFVRDELRRFTAEGVERQCGVIVGPCYGTDSRVRSTSFIARGSMRRRCAPRRWSTSMVSR